MPNDVTIISVDLAQAVEYVADQVLSMFGRDKASVAAREALQKQLSVAAQIASTVQVIGMARPVPIEDIYQSQALINRSNRARTDVRSLISAQQSAVIFGGPGYGKTILMHHIFASLARSRTHLPILVTLRWPNASDDLAEIVSHLAAHRVKPAKPQRVLLLVDGYDEIPTTARLSVADSMRRFVETGLGEFYLTCRTFYHVDDIRAPHYELAPFSRLDAISFVQAFGRYASGIHDATTLLEELEARGFADFASHPLMLTLVCILKTSSMPTLPRNTIGLIRRAIQTLTVGWDESKRVQRTAKVPLPIDGEDRVRCMMRTAYDNLLVADETAVERSVRDHLRLAQWENVDPQALLQEIAQWYGILVPVGNAQWSFVHRTIHDFLAARFWVESGRFRPDEIQTWSSRAAYAACLSPDATEALQCALRDKEGIAVLIECLYNNASFAPAHVARACIDHFVRFPLEITRFRDGDRVTVACTQDFFSLASNDLLRELIVASDGGDGAAYEVPLAYAAAELQARAKLAMSYPCTRVLRNFAIRTGATALTAKRSSGRVDVVLLA